MARILNLTRHAATIEEQEAGVVDPTPEMIYYKVQDLIADDFPQVMEIFRRINILTEIALVYGVSYVLIEDGSLSLLYHALAESLEEVGVTPICSIEELSSVENI